MVISENSVFVLFHFEADSCVKSSYNVLYHFLFHKKRVPILIISLIQEYFKVNSVEEYKVVACLCLVTIYIYNA